jgi:hypothetical protein
MAEFPDLDVEQEEKSFGNKKAGWPIKAASIQIDGADVENGRREDGHQQKGKADEKEVSHDGRCIYAVVEFV